MTAGRKNIDNELAWNTPPVYVDAVVKVLGEIELDPCSNRFSTVPALRSYSLPVDGLEQPWNARTLFLNPPYGRDAERGTSIAHWIHKAFDAHNEFGTELLMLIPVATNTRHWKDGVFKYADGICFLADTRLKFYLNGEEWSKGAPMACAMVYAGNDLDTFKAVFSEFGTILTVNS